MLTQQEFQRFQRHFDYYKVLDPAIMKTEAISEDIRDATMKAEQKLKRTRGKVVIFVGEMR